MPTKPPHILGINVNDIPKGHYGWIQISGHIHQDEELFSVLVRQAEQVWIKPEYEDRKGRGIAPDKVTQALIVMPHDSESKVFFNAEAPIQVSCSFKRTDIRPKKGDPILYGDIKHIDRAFVPHVKKGDGYILIYWDRYKYHIWFECPDYGKKGEIGERKSGRIDGLNAQYFINDAVKKWLNIDKRIENELSTDGWWPALTILPQPWLQLVNSYYKGIKQEGIDLVAEFLSKDLIRKLFDNWMLNPLFKLRCQPLHELVDNFKRDNHFSVSQIAVSQINGILREFTKRMDGHSPREMKLADSAREKRPFSENSILAFLSSEKYIDHLKNIFFKHYDSAAEIDEALMRHPLMHGDVKNATKAMALQGILSLDSLFHTIQNVTLEENSFNQI